MRHTVTRDTGEPYPLTIAAIFVVVFAAMWGGVQHSRGDLLPAERIEADERQVREALWTGVVEWRADRGLGPPRRVSETTASAQSSAASLATGSRPSDAPNADTSASGTGPPEAGPHLTGSNRCSSLLIRRTVDHPGWSDDPGSRLNAATADEIAADLLAALVAADDAALLERAGTFRTGLGVAARGDEFVVVYRSCARRRLP
jgi:hypothetical protein